MFLGSGFASLLRDPWERGVVCEGLLAGFVCGRLLPTFPRHGRLNGHLRGSCRVDL